jgi:para-aminobenzoate synthetase/4-amino-4-deoxychorismate lyase
VDGVYETMLVERGRVRLVERHLARLRRAGVAEARIAEVETVIRRAIKQSRHVLRIDVATDRIVERPRAPKPATTVRLAVTLGYEPGTSSREEKRIDRDWAAPFEQQARDSGFDEALLTSAAGLVAETTRANVFIVQGDAIVTAPAVGLLPGVTRSWVMDVMNVHVREIERAELRDSDAVFLTTSGRGIVEVHDIEGRPFHGHPVVEQLAAEWSALP